MKLPFGLSKQQRDQVISDWLANVAIFGSLALIGVSVVSVAAWLIWGLLT